MAKVAVVTGGGSGIGLAVAKLMPYDTHTIITGRSADKLERAVEELAHACVDASAFVCDVSDPEQVADLVEYALSKGGVRIVIHAAGVGPTTSDALGLFRINAAGTMNVDQQFAQVMEAGGVILNVASMSGYMLPADRVPLDIWHMSENGADALVEAFDEMLVRYQSEHDAGVAYTMSKNFVMWFTRRMAVELGPRGLRVVSISPGTIATPMATAVGQSALSFAQEGPLRRVGEPAEIARMMMFMVTEATYLSGTDILYDGGVIAGLEVQKEREEAYDRMQAGIRG